ncbi:MAG TPA: Rid family hydrolase [Xanthobacteraceae bacterium]|jgi:enamine deaminase RidA (YjgF/YER057c/UK114 family)
MTNFNGLSGLQRRAFLGGAASAGVASALAPRAAAAQATAPAMPSGSRASNIVRVTQRLAGSAINHAYAVKAGPFVFLNGHEGYDFTAGVTPAVAGAPGFPDFGKPGLRREADFILQRMGELLKSYGTDFAHSVRLDQYYTEANAVRAYHLARFAAFGKYIPPSTSMIVEACFGAKSTMTTSLLAVLPDSRWQVEGVYPKDAAFFAYSGYAPAVGVNDFVFAAGAGPDVKDVRSTDAPVGPHYLWSTQVPIRRQAESALKKIESTLNAAGTSLANCIKAQAHVAGAENFPDFLDVWNAHIGNSPAALTVTPAKGFSAVEIIVSINYILLKDGAQRRKEIVRADIPEMAAYSPAVRAGELLFTPGLLPMTRDGTVAGLLQGDNFPGLCLRSQLQAQAIYDHAEAIAKAADTEMRNLVRVNYWVSDIREFPGVAMAWIERYGNAPHPFACAVTPRLPAPGATVMADFWFYTG